MRYPFTFIVTATLAAALFSAHPAAAQISTQNTQTTVVTPVPALAPLVIPAPPGGTVQMEMDIHDDDLLGVFKSFLRGIGQGANAVHATTTTTTTGTTTTTTGIPSASQEAMRAQMMTVLNSADLSDVFKDTTHVHMEVFQVPGAGMGMGMMDEPDVKPIKGKPIAPPVMATTPDQTSFYENAFASEGGQRIVFVNVAPVHVLMTSFGHQRGYAFMVQLPGTIAVLRADGYPDLSKLSALATQVGAMAAQAAIPHVMPGSK